MTTEFMYQINYQESNPMMDEIKEMALTFIEEVEYGKFYDVKPYVLGMACRYKLHWSILCNAIMHYIEIFAEAIDCKIECDGNHKFKMEVNILLF